MPHRLEKINELLKQELGKILLKEGDFESSVLVTILKVETASDQKTADVYFSVWPNEKIQKTTERLARQTAWLQNLLYKKVSLRPTPKIKFVLNTEEVTGQRIDTLIKKLNQS